MAEALFSSVIEAPVEAIWPILRDLGRTDYFSEIVSCTVTPEGQGDRVGAIREIRLKDGSGGREQLVALSDLDHSVSYRLLPADDAPIDNYLAQVRLFPVTDRNHCLVVWSSTFDVEPEREEEMRGFLVDGVYRKCLEGVRNLVSQAG